MPYWADETAEEYNRDRESEEEREEREKDLTPEQKEYIEERSRDPYPT